MPTPLVLKGCRIFAGKYDVGDRKTELALSYEVEEKDATNMATGATMQAFPGLMKVGASFKAHWGAAPVVVATGKGEEDDVAFELFGDTVVHPISVCPENSLSGVDGKVALFWQAYQLRVQRGAPVGEILPIEVSHALGASRLVRGTFMLDGQKTVAGNGTGRNLGAVSATQKLYAVAHMVQLTGTTVTLKVQSDDASGFLTPVDQITLGPFTATGDDADEIAGAITDTWFRINYLGTFTSFTAIVAVGIAAK